MKHLLAIVLLTLAALASILTQQASAQSFALSPDTVSADQQLTVTIVGSGTHFRPSNLVSNNDLTTVTFGTNAIIFRGTPTIYNDTVMTVRARIASSAQVGSYAVEVKSTDPGNSYDWLQPNALHVVPLPSKILSVTPASAYAGETVPITIVGQNTNFSGFAGQIAINFKQNGTTIFQTYGDSVLTATGLTAHVTIPAGTAAGTYDIGVTNPGFNYSGPHLFTVLAGSPPTISVDPDSGQASTSLDVTIVGQGTHFTPSNNISTLVNYNVDLMNGSQLIYRTHPTLISTASQMTATLALADTIAPGMYQIALSPTLVTPFRVLPHPSARHTNDGPYAIQRGSSFTDTITVHGTRIRSGSALATNVRLSNGTTLIPAQDFQALNDTTFSASFQIPTNATTGHYDLLFTEPVTNRSITITNNSPTRQGFLTIVDVHFGVDSGMVGHSINTCLYPVGIDAPITNKYIRQGTTFISVRDAMTLPPCMPVLIDLDASIPTGWYDLVLAFGAGDSLIVPNAFHVLPLSGVDPDPGAASGISEVHASPNPATENFTVSFELASTAVVRLVIYDELGRTVATIHDGTLTAGTQHFAVPVDKLADGSYIYELSSNDRQTSGRFVVRH